MDRILPVRRIEKPWGRATLPPPFASDAAGRIGEIWFEPPAELDALLVKYIFTSEALSVQVHPSDAQTQASGLGRQGKEECWLILDAEPGAKLGIGLKVPADEATLHQAALDGSIERLLDWHPVAAGDFFYIPANTIHAIGAGISLIEFQQNSDITYRLYDYGRPRELHLKDGLSVAKGQPYPPSLRQNVSDAQSALLVDGPLFRLDQLCGLPDHSIQSRYGQAPMLVIPRNGTVKVGELGVAPGQCALASSINHVRFSSDSSCLIAQPAQAKLSAEVTSCGD